MYLPDSVLSGSDPDLNRAILDGCVKSHIQPVFVIQLKKEIKLFQYVLDSRLRGNDGCGYFLRIHQFLIIQNILKADIRGYKWGTGG